MRILLTVAYDGTDFYGYQVQPGKRTVQKELEDVLEKIYCSKISTICSGRTDSGVHALSQKVHFDGDERIPVEKVCYVMNGMLPKDVKVMKSEIVPDDFNARYSAKIKTYRYTIYEGDTENPLLDRFAVYYPFKYDIEKINEGIKEIVGTKDYKCFLASGSSVQDTVRTVYSIEVIKKDNVTEFYVKGNGFLYKMVRNIVGTLLDIGREIMTSEDLKNAMETGNRMGVGKTMPGKGLCLYRVEY